MRNLLRIFFFIFLFILPLFALQTWKIKTDDSIVAKPVFFDNIIAVASNDGYVYYIYWQTGNLMAKAYVGQKINELEIGNGVIFALSTDKITMLDKTGNILKAITESEIYYGIVVDGSIYATTNEGLKAFDYDGNIKWTISQNNTTLTEPLLIQNKSIIIFGSGNELVVANLNGTETTRINVAPFWKSKPTFYNNVAFIGSTNGKMYAVDIEKKKIMWDFETGAWIMSNPLYSEGNLYFGSNDGYVYAINANTGKLVWKNYISEAIWENIETITFGNRTVVVTGSNNNKVYGFDAKNGSITFTFAGDDWTYNPTFYSNMLFFSSYGGYYYAYIIDRGCSIDSPSSQESIAYKPFNVSGRVFSKNQNMAIYIRVSDNKSIGNWMKTTVSGNEWSYVIDPTLYAFGKLFIECKVSDAAGEETRDFAYRMFLRDKNLKKEKMNIKLPSLITEDNPFTIEVYDKNNLPLDNFTVILEEKTILGSNGTVSLVLNNAGSYNLLVRKIGYEDEIVSLNTGYDIMTILLVAASVVVILSLAFYFFVYKKK